MTARTRELVDELRRRRLKPQLPVPSPRTCPRCGDDHPFDRACTPARSRSAFAGLTLAVVALLSQGCATVVPWVGKHPALATTLTVVGSAIVAGQVHQQPAPGRSGMMPRVCQTDARACL